MDQIKKEELFSDLSLYQQHEGEPQEPAGEVAIQALCAPLKESELRIGLNVWALWPTDKLYYKAVIFKIQNPKLNKGKIFCRWSKGRHMTQTKYFLKIFMMATQLTNKYVTSSCLVKIEVEELLYI